MADMRGTFLPTNSKQNVKYLSKHSHIRANKEGSSFLLQICYGIVILVQFISSYSYEINT